MRTPAPTGEGGERERVEITVGGETLTALSMARDGLLPGASLEGPAILAEPSSTTFVPAGWRVECLPSGDLLLTDLLS